MAPRPDAAPSSPNPGDLDLGWNLAVLLQRYLELANAAFSDLPGGPRGYQVITLAERERSSSQVKMATRLGIDRTVMTYLIDELVEAGLVEREVDPSDRRARFVRATTKGKRLLPRLDRRLAAVEADLLGGLAEADADGLRLLLRAAASIVTGPDEAFDPNTLAAALVRTTR